jgi:hypothetical protein
MRIVQKNPEALVLDVSDIGIGTTSTGGMVSGLRLLLKGKNEAGQIKRFEVELASFDEVVALREKLAKVQPFSSQVNDLARAH